MNKSIKKMTINQLLELIDGLSEKRKNLEEVARVKEALLKIKFDPVHNGYGGNLILENTNDLLIIINRHQD